MIDQDGGIEQTNMESDFNSDYVKERKKPISSKNHGVIQLLIGAALLINYKHLFQFMSEVKLALPEVDKAVPDISIYPKMEIDLLKDEIEMTEPPITTIEILSPKQAFDDLKDKIFNIYFPGGVQSAWIVIPTVKSVFVFSPDKTFKTFNAGKLKDPVTGIELDMESLFP